MGSAFILPADAQDNIGIVAGLVVPFIVSDQLGKIVPVAWSKAAAISTIGAILNSNLIPVSVKVGGVMSGILMGTEMLIGQKYSPDSCRYSSEFRWRVCMRGFVGVLFGSVTAVMLDL